MSRSLSLGELVALAAELRREGPRYTSYPSVPFWHPEPSDSAYRDALAALASRPHEPVAVYVHLPFCLTRCTYCGCHAVVNRAPAAPDRYLDHVAVEIERVATRAGPRQITQLHWGGGTPNYLTGDQLRRLAGLFCGAFTLAPDAEVSIEMDPRAAHPGQAWVLRELGFNRVSLGVQDLDPAVQEAIGRRQSEAQTVRLLQECRAAGFASVNVDLVYGLPGQTPGTLERTIARVIDLSPDRLALFGYAHVPHLRPNQRAIDASTLPGPAERLGAFHDLVGHLTTAGYEWIGLDHFARPADPLAVAARERRLQRTFMGYTERAAPHLLGFGASSIGRVAGRFVQNEPALRAYGERLAAGALPVVRGLSPDADDLLRGAVIEHVMCNLEVPWELTRARFGIAVNEALPDEVARLDALEEAGLVELNPQGVRVSAAGRYFLRNVAMTFDRHLRQEVRPGTFSTAV
jgi:oxygen-independent coproporphyrinogen III oxidase